MSKLVMIIEDDIKSSEVLEQILILNNYRVISAKNGNKGIQYFDMGNDIPDIILCDIMMPEMNGYDFYIKISKDYNLSKIPFFFLSAKSRIEDVRFGKMLGADDYISKPYDFDSLLKKIKKKLKEIEVIKSTSSSIQTNILNELKKKIYPFSSKIDYLYLYYLVWDQNKISIIEKYYPDNKIPSLRLNEFLVELFHSIVKIYDVKNLDHKEFIFRFDHGSFEFFSLLNKNISKDGTIKTYMLTAIAPSFHYLQSEKIKKILQKLSEKIKNKLKIYIKEEWLNLFNYYSKEDFNNQVLEVK